MRLANAVEGGMQRKKKKEEEEKKRSERGKELNKTEILRRERIVSPPSRLLGTRRSFLPRRKLISRQAATTRRVAEGHEDGA